MAQVIDGYDDGMVFSTVTDQALGFEIRASAHSLRPAANVRSLVPINAKAIKVDQGSCQWDIVLQVSIAP